MLDWHQINDIFDDGITSDFFGTLSDREFIDVTKKMLSRENVGINEVMSCTFGENCDKHDPYDPNDESTHPFSGVRYERQILGWPCEFTQVTYDEMTCDVLICCRLFIAKYPEKRPQLEQLLTSHHLQL
jgi:hypothetical protein